jgi:hypothetical protein
MDDSDEQTGNFKPNAYKPDSFGYSLSKYYRVDAAKRAAYQRKYPTSARRRVETGK